jgi:hypothetical protein
VHFPSRPGAVLRKCLIIFEYAVSADAYFPGPDIVQPATSIEFPLSCEQLFKDPIR